MLITRDTIKKANILLREMEKLEEVLTGFEKEIHKVTINVGLGDINIINKDFLDAMVIFISEQITIMECELKLGEDQTKEACHDIDEE